MTTAGTDLPPAAAPVDIEGVRPAVDQALTAFLTQQRPLVAGVSPALAHVADYASTYLDGGKRLRPAFCYWGWRATGRPGGSEIIRAAASLELLQACALVHDDVMDGSDTRRGRPAAHRYLQRHHLASKWLGDDVQFGVGAAILLGDLYLTWSDQLFTTSGVTPDTLGTARSLFDQMRTELMAGQYLDLVVQAQLAPATADVRSVLRYKSAKYTIERPLQLGALLAGADDRLVADLGAFGLPLGEAFQLRDDLLGVFGDPTVTGKPAGDDLREGKQTLLIALARATADDSGKSALAEHLGNPELTDDQIDRLRDILLDSGAVAAVEAEIDRLQVQATAALTAASIDQEARAALTQLVQAAVRRVK